MEINPCHGSFIKTKSILFYKIFLMWTIFVKSLFNLLQYFGERNGNPLQCSCLKNPRDGEAWWAAVCGVAQSRTRLKQLSSSSRTSHQALLSRIVMQVLAVLPGLPLWVSGKEPACNAGDTGSIPGLGRFLQEGHGNPLQYSCLENLMNRRAWWATVHGVAKSQTRLSD